MTTDERITTGTAHGVATPAGDPSTGQASRQAAPAGPTTSGGTSAKASAKATGSKPAVPKGSPATKKQGARAAQPAGKPITKQMAAAAKKEKAKAEKVATKRSTERPSTAGLKTFAFRLPPTDSAKIHKAAGPQRASEFAIAILLAAATEDPAKLTAALRQQIAARDARVKQLADRKATR